MEGPEEKEEVETNKTKREKKSGEEAQKYEARPKTHTKEGDESLRVSPKPTKKEAVVALISLGTHIKPIGKRQRQNPLYFRTRRSTRIKQGRPQTPTKTPIIIEDSPKGQEKLVSPEMKGEYGTSKQASPMSPITYFRRPVTRSTSANKIKEPLTPFQERKILLQETQTILQETLSALQETQKKQEGQQQRNNYHVDGEQC